MKLQPEDVRRLETFLGEVAAKVCPEPPSRLHTELTAQVWKKVAERCALPAAPACSTSAAALERAAGPRGLPRRGGGGDRLPGGRRARPLLGSLARKAS